MFFTLSETPKENFPHHYNLPNGLVLNTDDGWERFIVDGYAVVAKGYSNKYRLETVAEFVGIGREPHLKGNFCAFVCDHENVRITHDTNRSFHLWVSDSEITNLFATGEQIWTDCLISVDSNMNVHREYFEPYNLPTENVSDESIVEGIHNTLCETFENFLSHNTLPIKIFLSGGVDTTLAWAYLDHFTKNYEIVDYEYMKYTYFYKMNRMLVKKFWCYKQIHSWDTKTLLVSGACGDEYLMRGPFILSCMLRRQGLTLQDILEPKDYHYKYMSEKVFDTDDVWEHNSKILDMNINDHQHWHIDNTISFTPFKDIKLFEPLLGVSKELLVQQAKDARINKMLIEKLDPKKLSVVSDQKNFNNFEKI